MLFVEQIQQLLDDIDEDDFVSGFAEQLTDETAADIAGPEHHCFAFHFCSDVFSKVFWVNVMAMTPFSMILHLEVLRMSIGRCMGGWMEQTTPFGSVSGFHESVSGLFFSGLQSSSHVCGRNGGIRSGTTTITVRTAAAC